MAERQPACVELLLQPVAVDTRLASAHEVGLVDLKDAVKGAHVEDQLAGHRRERSAYSAASPHRRDRYVVGGCQAQHSGDLLATYGTDDEHTGRCLAGTLVHDRERPQVADRALINRCRAHDLLELAPHWPCLAAFRPASHPVRIGTPKPHGPL